MGGFFLVGKIQEDLLGVFFSKDLGFGKFSFKRLVPMIQPNSHQPTSLSKRPKKEKQHLEVGAFHGLWMGFFGTLGLSLSGDGGQKIWKVMCGK